MSGQEWTFCDNTATPPSSLNFSELHAKLSSKRFPNDLSDDSSGRSPWILLKQLGPPLQSRDRVCCPVVRVTTSPVSLREEVVWPGQRPSANAGLVRATPAWCDVGEGARGGHAGKKVDQVGHRVSADLLQEEQTWESRVQRWLSPPASWGQTRAASSTRQGLCTASFPINSAQGIQLELSKYIALVLNPRKNFSCKVWLQIY